MLELKKESSQIEDNLVERLSLFLKQYPNQIVGAYDPWGNEVNWLPLEAQKQGQWAFPRWGDEQMEFKLCDWKDLEKGLGPHQASAQAPTVVPDILLIPGLGFSLDGFRLGRGGGHYDRYLENFRGKKVGLCFDIQLINFEAESHDQRVDLIITDKQTVEVKSWE